MYNGFFGFREKPFKLIPNPDFLFLGKSHEEALAHLTYATSQGDGFVEITGEVGTGKTTLCRVFLEDLDKDIEVAYIFNSKLDSIQLLKAIHTELGVTFTSENPAELDPVDLTNTLNRFLLEKKSAGKSVILLIDEAQHLGSETMEQLRLLSNLETTKSKLLQIILVGQPELGEILDSFEMRQLRQRINLSCHLLPLSLKETRDYIDHRIKVASNKSNQLFSGNAKKIVYKYSNGIPRRINIICDRALLVAYSRGKDHVSAAIVRSALKELEAPRYKTLDEKNITKKIFWPMLTVILAVSLLIFSYYLIPSKWMTSQPAAAIEKKDITISKKITDTSLQKKTQAPAPPHVEGKPLPLLSEEPMASSKQLHPISMPRKTEKPQILKTIGEGADRETIFGHILNLWNNNLAGEFKNLPGQIERDEDFFRMAGMQNNILVLHFEQGIEYLEKFNFPAILRLNSKNQLQKQYIALVQITDNNEYVILSEDKNQPVKITKENLHSQLTGDVFITCKNIFGYTGVIAEKSPKFCVLSVKLLLRQIGYDFIDLSPVYDQNVKKAVKHIQSKYGLTPDGVVGSKTKFVFIQEKNEVGTPFLTNRNRADVQENMTK